MYLWAHGTPQTKFAFSQRTLASSEEALETLETGNFFQKSSLTRFTIWNDFTTDFGEFFLRRDHSHISRKISTKFLQKSALYSIFIVNLAASWLQTISTRQPTGTPKETHQKFSFVSSLLDLLYKMTVDLTFENYHKFLCVTLTWVRVTHRVRYRSTGWSHSSFNSI